MIRFNYYITAQDTSSGCLPQPQILFPVTGQSRFTNIGSQLISSVVRWRFRDVFCGSRLTLLSSAALTPISCTSVDIVDEKGFGYFNGILHEKYFFLTDVFDWKRVNCVETRARQTNLFWHNKLKNLYR